MRRGKNNKAQSEIITVVLIILLVMAAVIIVWTVVKKTVSEGTGKLNSETFNSALEIRAVTLPLTGGATVEVSRGPGEGNIDSLKLVFEKNDGSAGTVTITDPNYIPKELETKVIILNITKYPTLYNIKKVSVASVSGSNIGIMTSEPEDQIETDDAGNRVYNALENPADIGLVSWWSFDEGSGDKDWDLIGNSNLNVSSVGSIVNWDSGKKGYGLNYLPSAKTQNTPCPVGAYNFSISPANVIYNLPQSRFTFTAWLKITADGTIVRFTTNNNKPACCNGLDIMTYVATMINNTGNDTGMSYSFPKDNSWHHFAYVFDLPNHNQSAYIDGKINKSVKNLYGTYSVIKEINFGKYGNNWCAHAPYAITGTIDEAMLFNKALSPAEVKALYNNQK